jgi:hypothetical protein
MESGRVESGNYIKMKKIILFAAIAAFITGCSKHPVMPSLGKAIFKLNYVVDSLPLNFDTLSYDNDAGNEYSVSKLEYYLSNFSLRKKDGSKVMIGSYYYINSKDAAKGFFTIDSIPLGNYTGISFSIGLPPDLNKTGALPSISENINMSWPDPMGGGYHFMKFEGHYKDSASFMGYAIHLGTNATLINISMDYPMEIKYQNHQWQLEMNLNEWFRNPHIYDLSSDGNYTMNVMEAMMKMTQNGSTVFSVNTNCH